MPSSILAALVAVLALGMAADCGSSKQVPQAAPAVRVEADLFSGRPNPAWELSAEQARSFLETLRELPAREGRSFEAPDALGYRGIVAAFDLDTEGAVTARFHRGTVYWKAESSFRELTDENRHLERWLVETGGPSLDPGVHRLLLDELGQ